MTNILYLCPIYPITYILYPTQIMSQLILSELITLTNDVTHTGKKTRLCFKLVLFFKNFVLLDKDWKN